MLQNVAPPIFIVRPQRPATTLLATMLNAHSTVFLANETEVFVTLPPRISTNRAPLPPRAAAAIAEPERHHLVRFAPLPGVDTVPAELTRPAGAALASDIPRLLGRREGQERWGEKTALGYRRFGTQRCSYPDGTFITLERDPADIAISYQSAVPTWGALGGLMHWLDLKRMMAREAQGVEILSVPYQALVSDPEGTLRWVCEYLGEPYQQGMLDFYNTQRAAELRASTRTGCVARPLYASTSTARDVRQGLLGRVFRECVVQAESFEPRALRPAPRGRALRALLFLRAALWGLRQPQRVARSVRLLVPRLGRSRCLSISAWSYRRSRGSQVGRRR